MHPNAFLSLSTVINSRSPNHLKLIEAVSDDRILVESDIHEIGQVTSRTCDMIEIVSRVKGWGIEETWEERPDDGEWGAVHKLKRNFERFMSGGRSLSRG